MNVVLAKPGVRFDVIQPAGFRILGAIDQVAQQCGLTLIISCGSEGHAPADPHTTGEAYDVSTTQLSAQQIDDAKRALEQGLGPLFTVLYEVPKVPSDPTLRPIAFVNTKATAPHFHIQRRKDTVFPPTPDPAEIRRA